MGEVIFGIAAFLIAAMLITGIFIVALFIWCRTSLAIRGRKYRQADITEHYFEHAFRPRLWVEIDRHMLHYTRDSSLVSPAKRVSINLYRIKTVHVYFFKIFVRMDNGKTHQLPTGFKHQDQIYGALKYYRPAPATGRKAISTRIRT